jgi:hypothetical protein
VVAARFDAPPAPRLIEPTELKIVPQPPMGAPHEATKRASQFLKLEWGAVSGPEAAASREAKVTYDVQASRDGGKTWQTLAVNVPTPTTEIDVAEFKDDPRVDIRVIANSGFDSKVIAQRSIAK